VYAHSHLPGAINLPSSGIDPARVARRIPDPQTEIVVYCSSSDCDDSVATAQRLQELGYTNVRHYTGGKNEWRDVGLPLERAGKPFAQGQQSKKSS
jgi:rhodanese-related sulfurtransferase